MANQYNNKVVLGSETLIDITDTTATASDVAQGRYFYLASGQKVAGSASGGHVSQDAQGYLVLDDDAMSGAPSGTVSITANGNHDVTNYAQASVAVVQTYTATISGTGSSEYHYVQKNGSGTKYYDDGDTFTFEDGDDICVVYRSMGAGSGGTTLTANGELIRRDSESATTRNYTVEDPRCDITIEFTRKTVATMSNINFVVPQASVTSVTANGMASIGGCAFANVAVPGMSETDLSHFIQRSSSFTDITWPSGLTTIGPYAFANCIHFNPPSLPNTVTNINMYAFQNCTDLALTSLPSGITTINTYAFKGCTKLALTSLPSGLISINDSVFYQCTSLALTSLPSGVTTIGSNAFFGCTSLALTSLPSSVTTINSYAFQNCTNLALTSLPSGVTSIYQYSFKGCTSLALTSLPSGVTTIQSYAFQSCTSLALTSLPSSVTSIGGNAFQNCTGITTISCDGVITTLNSNAFIGDSTNAMQLTSVSFPNLAITTNLSTVFGSTTAENACQLLEFCDIGNAVGFASNAFANCYSLTKLVIRKSTVAALAATSAFTNTPMRGYDNKTGTVYVPSSLIASYQTATNWKTLYDAGTVTFSAIEGSDYELE